MDLDLLNYLQSFLTERRILLFKEVISKRTLHFTVAMEDIYQMHNTSAVMRSCDVFGIQELYVVEEKLGKKMDREIAMGAQKWVNLYRYNNSEQCLKNLKSKGYQIVATTPHEKATLLQDFDVSKKSAFFFGKENEGLSDMVLNEADVLLKIPMYGFTESLNISVSAAIILQNVVMRLKQSEINWQLSDEEQLELELEWTKKCIKNVEGIISQFQLIK